MRINDYIYYIKDEKCISDIEFANIIEKNINWVDDFKDDEEELNGLSITHYKKMCKALEINPDEVYKIVISDLRELNIFELLKKRREEKYWNIDDLADRVGYEIFVIEALEKGEKLEKVCIDALKKITIELDLPFDYVMRRICANEVNENT